MRLLLDTSGYVGFKLGIPELVDFLMEARAILLSPIVLGELMFGFRLGTRFRKNMDELGQFMKQETVEATLSADHMALLLFRVNGDERMAVPLSLVARLESIAP